MSYYKLFKVSIGQSHSHREFYKGRATPKHNLKTQET